MGRRRRLPVRNAQRKPEIWRIPGLHATRLGNGTVLNRSAGTWIQSEDGSVSRNDQIEHWPIVLVEGCILDHVSCRSRRRRKNLCTFSG